MFEHVREVASAIPGILLTVLCWGAYGSVLHKGQHALGNDRLKPLICVGIAYFVLAIIVPVVVLSINGKLGGGWSFSGISWSLAAGAAGACGAFGIILALTYGGSPTFVMPLVFGGAPIINVMVSMYFQGITFKDAGAKLPMFMAGVVMVAVGAAMVLVFAPKPKVPPKKHAEHQEAKAEQNREEPKAEKGSEESKADSTES